MTKERFKIIPAVYLILIKDGKALLLRRFNTGYEDGNYSLPAGHVDENESFMEAMIREAKEEIGIDIDIKDLKVGHIMHRVPLGRIGVFIKAEKWTGEVKNMEPHKCDNLNWFAINDLPENTIPYIKSAIENTRSNNFYSEDK